MRAALGGLIDHAALFPPASMPVGEALDEDRAARAGDHAWMIARFVCPASKLDALRDAAGGWEALPPLSLVLDGGLEEDAALVSARLAEGAPVEALELRLHAPRPDPKELLAVRRLLAPLGLACYLELVRGERWRDTLPAAIGAAASLGQRVKLRCGGARDEDFPTPEQVALVIVSCREAGCAFKATAGLHHPVRSGSTHGFLNLLAAASCTGARESELVQILGEDDPGAFVLEDGRLAVGRFEAGAAEVASARERLFRSYGSCSWREPVDDLRALGMLA